MRWLLLKDLQILRRSPLLRRRCWCSTRCRRAARRRGAVVGPVEAEGRVRQPRAAGRGARSSSAAQQLDATAYAAELFEHVDPIRVDTREEAIAKVESGEALGALVIPPDVIDRLQGTLAPRRRRPRRRSRSTTAPRTRSSGATSRRRSTPRWPTRTRRSRDEIFKEAARYLNLIVAGGERSTCRWSATVDILGLRNAQTIIDAAIAGLPEDSPSRVGARAGRRASRASRPTTSTSRKPILASIAQPGRRSRRRSIAGHRTRRSTCSASRSRSSISLMFVTLLLAAGMLALEREENAFGRLVRGLVSRTGLLVEKIGLAALCAWALAAVMLAVLVAFLDLDWSRTPAWLVALAFAAVAFAALGVAIGGLTREVRAASLLAFMLALPIAALALIPSGAVSGTLYDVIRIVSGAFPFKPALDALDAALSGGSIAGAAAPPRRAHARASARSRASRCGASREPLALSCQLCSPPPACAASAGPACCAAWCARRSSRRAHLVYPMFVRHGLDGRTPIASMPGIDHLSIARRRRRGRRGRRARHPGRAAVRAAGRARTRRARARGTTRAIVQLATRAIKAAASRPARDHRPLPVRVHEPRPLRRAARRRRGRQRPDARAARPHRGLPGRGRRRRRRAERHDGRPGRRAARRARRARARRDADHGLQRQVRLRLLRPVPRGRRVGAVARATAAATRWIPRTRSRACARRSSTPPRAPTSSWSSPRCPTST